ncbi:HesA/MoeB/ThiF family protein [Pseudomonas sp. ABY48]|uniref:HesA/MoeB/ThiF family protein n=1 Tax=Pseudomonas sp. ABY48 TaxID=3402865 RepID=UPI003B43C0EF
MQCILKTDTSRYARQIILSEVGAQGQQRLKDSKVLVVGAGGLGCPVLLYLAGAGVGTIGIVDATDNFDAKYLMSDAFIECEKPMVYASISQFEGQVSVFNYYNRHTQQRGVSFSIANPASGARRPFWQYVPSARKQNSIALRVASSDIWRFTLMNVTPSFFEHP